jgi:hypothetical protein
MFHIHTRIDSTLYSIILAGKVLDAKTQEGEAPLENPETLQSTNSQDLLD